MVAMSGGVDSTVAAALLVEAGHEVVGVTMKLWGGPSDSGCCSVSDVDDARRVAQQLGIDHHVFNFGDHFDHHVVQPYLRDHAAGRTPNPCIECNRHVKFDKLLRRADVLGFDVVATGHHARRVARGDGWRVARGADAAKDQSYVLHPLRGDDLARTWFPVGDITKAEVRAIAARLGLRTADKPDSQDVCFIAAGAGGRTTFLGERIPLRPGRVVDVGGREVGAVPAVELVTIGQRRGLDLSGNDGPRYVVDVDVASATVTVGEAADLLSPSVEVAGVVWADGPRSGRFGVQVSAHGRAMAATVTPVGGSDAATVTWDEPQRRVAPGQSVVVYDGDEVVGGGLALPNRR